MDEVDNTVEEVNDVNDVTVDTGSEVDPAVMQSADTIANQDGDEVGEDDGAYEPIDENEVLDTVPLDQEQIGVFKIDDNMPDELKAQLTKFNQKATSINNINSGNDAELAEYDNQVNSAVENSFESDEDTDTDEDSDESEDDVESTNEIVEEDVDIGDIF